MANRERSNSFNTIKYFILNATTYLTNTGNEVTETVTFVMGIKNDNSVEIDKSFIVITKKEDSENHTPDYLVVNEDIIFGANEEKYKPYNFSNLKYDINSDSMYLDNWSVLGIDNGEVDYVVDSLNIDNKLEIKGKVNIYVKGNVNITSNGWSTNTNKDNLNVFIIPKPNDNINRLIFNAKNVGNESIRANFYVGSGNVNIKLQNSVLNSNIISNGKRIYLHSQTGGDEHQVLNGSIYAPLSLVHMDLNNLGLNGYIVAKNLKLFHQNGKNYPKESKLVLQDDSKQIIDTESKADIFKGYYK